MTLKWNDTSCLKNTTSFTRWRLDFFHPLKARLLSPVEGSNLTWKKISATTFSLRPEFVHCGLLGQQKEKSEREKKSEELLFPYIIPSVCCSVLIAGVLALAFVVVPFQKSLFFHEQLWLLNLAVWCALWPPQIMLPVSLPGRSYFFIPLVFFHSSLFIFYFLLESKRASHSKLLFRRTITITQQTHTVYPKSNLPSVVIKMIGESHAEI